MRKIKKPNPPEHLVLVDTNILWHENKAHVVNPDFEEFWSKYSASFPMKLIIPEAVRGELLYQQTESALKLLKKVNADISSISGITSKTYSHRVTEERIRKEVEDRFDLWVSGKLGEIKDTPLSEIDWKRVVNDSIWRRLPFTPDAKNPKNEKGFRDCLILETVCSVCRFYSDDVNIAFICNDYALRTASDKRLGKIDSFSSYESLNDFKSFIELTKKDLNERFVKSILNRASEKFHSTKSRDTLIFKDGFYSKLWDEFRNEIDSPADPEPLSYLGSRNHSWNHTGDEQVWVTRPYFKELVGEREYHWISTITIVRIFERDEQDAFLSNLIISESRRLLVFPIEVHWKANVRADGRFFACEIVEYNKGEVTFDAPTPDQLERYGLQKRVEIG